MRQVTIQVTQLRVLETDASDQEIESNFEEVSAQAFSIESHTVSVKVVTSTEID